MLFRSILLLGDDTQVRGGKDIEIKDAVQKFADDFPEFSLRSSKDQNSFPEKTRLWAMKAISRMHLSESEMAFPLWDNFDISNPVVSKIGTCRP